MTRTVLLLVLTSAVALAQQAAPPAVQPTNRVEQETGPTYSDLYCSGFVTNQAFDRSRFVIAGLDSPNTTLMVDRNTLYLNGSGYEENQLYSIIREVRDLNRYESFPGQRRLLNEVGHPYADLGRVRVIQVRPNLAVAHVEFSCQDIAPGDLVVPFQERPSVPYRRERVKFNQFPISRNITGRIVMAKEFDMFLGTGQKAYINAGADKGIKAGDYLRVVRGYDPSEMDPAEALSYMSPAAVDTQKYPPEITRSDRQALPKRALGEVLILSVTPTAATGMITLAVDSIKVGDQVELEGGPR